MTRQQRTVLKILEVKEFNKEQLEAEAKKARVRLHLEQEKLDALDREYSQTSGDFSDKQASGAIPVRELELFTTYLKHLGKQIDQQKSIVAIRESELGERQAAMVEAYKEQRLFEILNDRIREEEVRVSLQVEQKEADFQYLTRKGQE